ncbi:MAG: Gfo/Idh/MocA family oxidoreductase, partial [Planctomycetaceae bacterium]
MPLTEEQKQIGQDNFNEAVASDAVRGETMRDISRRTFLKGAAAGGVTLGSLYFGYGQLAQNDRVKVGFIGTGDEGSILITEHPQDYMDIVAIADIRPSNRKRAVHGDGNEHRIGLINKLGRDKALSIKLFDDHKQLLAAKDELGLEAVVIAVPLNMHAPIALECMQAGLHVLTEKLMAHSIAECKQMIKAARENNVLLAVGHQRHYSVLYDNANDLVRRGLLGDIRYIQAQWHRNNSFPGRDSWRNAIHPDDHAALKDVVSGKYGYESLEELVNWRLYNRTGGGLMAELGSHQLDA